MLKMQPREMQRMIESQDRQIKLLREALEDAWMWISTFKPDDIVQDDDWPETEGRIFKAMGWPYDA
jgi:hypothetical protein